MKNLFKALAEFQSEVPVIHQDTKGFNYTYANLSTIFKVVKPLLKKHGLMFTQPLTATSLKTIVVHIESGEMLESEISLIDGVVLNKMNDFQVMGSQITYLRRYSLSSILGLITDKDIDAAGVQEPKVKPAFTEAHFEKAKNAGATIEKIKAHYSVTAAIEKKYNNFKK